ncbi:hypothetical protein [Pseudomonas putida]
MSYEERFEHLKPQFLDNQQALHTSSGLSIRANGNACASLHETFKGIAGNELVIGEHCDIEIAFAQEVEQLTLDYYVVCDDARKDPRILMDTDDADFELYTLCPHNFYWLTLSGSGYTEFLPGPLATEPRQQQILGPFRRLTISTSQAGSVHIRKLEWTRTCRH